MALFSQRQPRQSGRWLARGGLSVGLAQILLGALLMTGCATAPFRHEPLNLSEAKEAVLAYADTGRYDEDLRMVSKKAKAWVIERSARAQPGERLAVVFDVDETVLSNLPHMREMDFGYIVEPWSQWVALADAPALVPVREVYEECRRRGVAVIFITGRKEPQDRAGTEKNLRREGMGDYLRLILARPEESGMTTVERKAGARAAVERNEGYHIIASVGDQWSDLEGGSTERVFKLPNPFYRIP